MNNNFFYLLINPAKKNTDRFVLKENIISDSFKKIVDKMNKKYNVTGFTARKMSKFTIKKAPNLMDAFFLTN